MPLRIEVELDSIPAQSNESNVENAKARANEVMLVSVGKGARFVKIPEMHEFSLD